MYRKGFHDLCRFSMEAHQDYIDPFAEGACTTHEGIPRVLYLFTAAVIISYAVYKFHKLVGLI